MPLLVIATLFLDSGAYAPALSETHNAFVRLMNNKGFTEESMTKVGLDAIGTSTPLASNKSLLRACLKSLRGLCRMEL